MSHAAFEALRVKMVDGQLRTTDVTSHAILSAFLTVPRERFVPAARQDLAYLDGEIEIAPGRFLMEPSPLAKLIQLADVQDVDKALIIGAGTGYSAAVLSQIVQSVTAVEDVADLAVQARANLAALGSGNVDIVEGPLASGAASKGPFDVILVEGAVDRVPDGLFAQLSEGGRLVAVTGSGLSGVANVHVKYGSGVSARRGFNLSVKPLPAFAAPAAFVF